MTVTSEQIAVSHADDDSTDPLHKFTLTLYGVTSLSPGEINALDEAGCGDALILVRGGWVTLDFARRAPTLLAAQMGARADVMRAGFEVFSISSPASGQASGTDRTDDGEE
jgi:hypothetical protein